MKRKRILIIVQHLFGGGAERVAADVGDYLRQDNDVLLVTFDNSFENAYSFGGKQICINMTTKFFFMKPFMTMRRACKIRTLKKDYQIDYSISFLRNANIVNVLSRYRDKIIVSVRTNIGESTQKKERILEKYICCKADKIVTLSNGVKDNLIQVLNIKDTKVQTIYNMCDVDKLFSGKMEQNKEKELINSIEGKYCLYSCGSLRYPKGHWHLLKVFKLIHDIHPNTLLILFGDGEYRFNLIKLASLLGISDSVIMPGYIKGYNQLMLKYGKIFCFTSVFEGFGNVLLEAMACESAVVSSDCNYGPSEILAGKCSENGYTFTNYGVLTPAFSKSGPDFSTNIEQEEIIMAQAIDCLIKDEDLRNQFVENAKVRLKDFSPKITLNEWTVLLSNLEEERNGTSGI